MDTADVPFIDNIKDANVYSILVWSCGVAVSLRRMRSEPDWGNNVEIIAHDIPETAEQPMDSVCGDGLATAHIRTRNPKDPGAVSFDRTWR